MLTEPLGEDAMISKGPERLRALIREPLVHFLAIGAAIFGFYSLSVDREVDTTGNRIVVSRGDVERLGDLWEMRTLRPPTADELEGLVREHVREEVLYREALALGLDRDDTVIRRLLRQKFEFVTQDLAVAREPDVTEIETFFDANRERYRTAPRLSVSQIFFNLDQRGAAGEDEAKLLLASLRDGASDAELTGLGDGQMLDSSYRDMPLHEVELRFGEDFAAALSLLEPGIWSGPLTSGYGLHMVRIDSVAAGEIPPLAAIEPRVRDDWAYQQRRQANETIYRELLSRYEVIVEGSAAMRSGREETQP